MVRVLLGVVLLLGRAAPLLLAASFEAAAQEPAAVDAGEGMTPEDARMAKPADAEGCLLCHRFPGLSRLDAETGELRLFFVSERVYADRAGPHTRLDCTGCHDRATVEKVPHDDVPPVDCSSSCHLVTASGDAVDFSHKIPTESLANSVHAPSVLEEQPFTDALLREGQSTCLFCHDDPTFRDVPTGHHRGVDPTVRCQTCHDDALPVDTEYYLRHTAGRQSSQRPAREAATVCAVCHSDELLNEHNEKHDAVTSYLRSYHGKAATLGSMDPATCVDCHSTEAGNVHQMLASDDPLSPTHPDNRALTCRTSECHSNAAPQISDAAVHMRVTPDSMSIEYFVMLFFLVLTVGTMTTYFALVVLELVNVAVRRDSPEHLGYIALAKAVQAHPVGGRRVARLTVHQRFQHWALVLSFLTLVFTGLPMKFSNSPYMPYLVGLFGGLSNARVLHRTAAVVIILTSLYHLVYLLSVWGQDLARRRREEPGRSIFVHAALTVWDSSLMLKPRDVLDFLLLFAWQFGLRKHRPEQGRFHFSQKFEYLAVFWGMVMIGVSGAMLWREDLASELLGGRALNFAFIVHSDEAFLALAYIAVAHFFAVMFSPAVFPLNLGSLTGKMPPVEMAENHLGHLKEVAAELGITAPPVERRTGIGEILRQLGRRSFALVQAAVVAFAAFLTLSFLVHEMTGGEKAIEIEEIPLRLDASVLQAPEGRHGPGAGAASKNRLQRGPVAHFHAIPTWFQPDTGTGCNAAGCHGPLPHSKRKEVRAFLNMHTTFVDCQLCHREGDLAGAEVAWLDFARRERRESPAVLRLATLLNETPPAQRPSPWDERLLATLEEAVEASGGDPELESWLVTLETSRVGGVLYDGAVAAMRERIDQHGHGEYGTKLGLPASSGRRWTPDAEQQAAMDQMRGPGDQLRVEERKRLVETVHRDLKKPEVECALCHTQEQGLLDFAALGYPKDRVDALRSNAIARRSQAVEQGETFFLPSVFGAPGQFMEITPVQPPEGAVPEDKP